jgi:salicylate hydroxylase
MVHRGDFHGVLLRAVEERMPGALHLGARCLGVEQDEGRVTLLIEDGRRVPAGVIVGADGVHSRIRQALFGGATATFTGFVAWRGLIPMGALPERLRMAVGTNWIGPRGHVVMYPLRRGTLLNVVAAIERDAWNVQESWTQRGSVAELRADFAPWHPEVQEIISHVEEPYQWALLGREPLERWSVGHVTLLGDACHPTLPFLAQGANMAIEDGMVLARCLDACPDVPEALRRYEASRLDRTSRIVRGAADNVHRFHNPGLADPAFAAEFVDREFQPARTRERYDYIFHYDALQVAV